MDEMVRERMTRMGVLRWWVSDEIIDCGVTAVLGVRYGIAPVILWPGSFDTCDPFTVNTLDSSLDSGRRA